MTVKGLTAEMAKLTVKLEAAISQGSLSYAKVVSQSESQPQPRQQDGGSYEGGSGVQRHSQNADIHPDYRSVVRQEIRELREREKRRFSLVIRGLMSNSPAGVTAEFGDITSTMMGTRVTLTEVVKIPNNVGLWRAKVLNLEHRELVLEKAKNLKGTQYDHIFIRKDLTYTQRMELKQRRESQGASTRVIRPSRGTAVPSAPSATALAPKQMHGASADKAPDTVAEISTPATPSETQDDRTAVLSGGDLPPHRAPAPSTTSSSSRNVQVN